MNRPILVLLTSIALCTAAVASGHGPVFGLATPVNSQGEWSFDLTFAGRNSVSGNQLTSRGLIGYGFTPHLMMSVSAPAVLSNASLPPTRLQAGDDFETNVAWRFHHNASKVGTRFESTAFGGLVVPGPQTGSGVLGSLTRAPGFTGGVVTGMASRSNYVWVGGVYTGFVERSGDKRPDVFTYSLVYGYRPVSWRKEPQFWDWRIFAELTGERSGPARGAGAEIAGSQAHQVFVGPSALGIKKNYAVEFGVQFPVYRNVGPLLQPERVRFVMNVSYFLFQHQHAK
ncbi:MAG: hypothetical protein JWO13_37 [Acidobacteriales bacterium]|nr:hypothetical protein [Terriglobales bacterium]